MDSARLYRIFSKVFNRSCTALFGVEEGSRQATETASSIAIAPPWPMTVVLVSLDFASGSVATYMVEKDAQRHQSGQGDLSSS